METVNWAIDLIDYIAESIARMIYVLVIVVFLVISLPVIFIGCLIDHLSDNFRKKGNGE